MYKNSTHNAIKPDMHFVKLVRRIQRAHIFFPLRVQNYYGLYELTTQSRAFATRSGTDTL